MSEVKAFLESLDINVFPKNIADKITMIYKDDAIYDYPENGEEFVAVRSLLESKYPQSLPGYVAPAPAPEPEPAGAGEPTEEQAREFMSTLEILADAGDTDAAELLESLRIIYGDSMAEGGFVGGFNLVPGRKDEWKNETGQYHIVDMGDEYAAFDLWQEHNPEDSVIASDSDFDVLVEKIFEYNSEEYAKGGGIEEYASGGVIMGLIDPNNNKIIKTRHSDMTYRESEEEVKRLNDILNKKGNSKGLYWKVTQIGNYAKGGGVKGNTLESIYKKGFVSGDVVDNEQPNPMRYLFVTNNGKKFIVGDNGERRGWQMGKSGKLLTGNLSLSDLKKQDKYAKGGGVGNINWRKHKELVDFERELKSKDDGSRIEDVILNANGDWLVYYVDNSGMTTKRDTKIIQNSYAKGGGISEKITQADLLNQNFKEAKEHIIEIHKRVKLKSGNELLLLKKESGWGIAKYNPKTKKELQWNSFSDKETANYWIDKVDVEKYAQGGAMAEGEDYEYINSFGISDADFQDMVDRYHAGELPDNSLNDKYGEKTVHKAASYIHAKHMSNRTAKGGNNSLEGVSRKFAEYYSGRKSNK
jgi:hypothetical protein